MSYPMRSESSAVRGYRGFTLVELLIVIGIIAILLSILLPSLGRAREHARAVICENNEKQIAAAVFLYLNDNHGELPLSVHPYPPYQTAYEAICMASAGQLDYENGLLWPYIARDVETRQRIFNCPSDPDPKYFDMTTIFPGMAKAQRNFSYNLTYELNRAWTISVTSLRTTDPPGVYALPITRVRDPEHKILVAERFTQGNICDGPTVEIGGDGRHIVSLLTSRHSGKANIAFFDGHCEPMDASTFEAETGDIFTPAYFYYVDVIR